MHSFAKLISIILGPVVWIPAMIFVFLINTDIPSYNRIILFISYAFFMFVAPFTFVVISYIRGKISDLDISLRRQRYKYLFVFILCLTILSVPVYIYGNPLLIKLQILIFIILAVNSLITFFWKISFHMATNVVGSLLVNYLFAWQLPYLFFSIPLVFWSRLYLKRHTIPQLLGALVLNGGITLLYLIIFLK